MKRIEQILELFLFNSRWLLVPFYVGLVIAIALLLVKFIKTFIGLIPIVLYGVGDQAVIGILTLVDITLVANLLIIMIFLVTRTLFPQCIPATVLTDPPGWGKSVLPI